MSDTLSRITLEDGLVFHLGGMDRPRGWPEGKEPPDGATDLTWAEQGNGDIEVIFYTPSETEGEPDTETSVTITADETAALESAVPEPEPVVGKWTPLAFLERFTPEEQAAIEGSDNLQVRIVKTQLTAASEVIADDPRTVAGMQALVDAGIITGERRDEILSAES